MPNLPLKAGCLCGRVRYEITRPLVFAGYCHCTRCQRRTGTAASASARIAPGSLRVLSGQELIKAWRPPEGFAKVFCSNCGGALWSQSQEDPEVISVRVGTFDTGHPPVVSCVRRLRRALGADPRRRSAALSRGAQVHALKARVSCASLVRHPSTNTSLARMSRGR